MACGIAKGAWRAVAWTFVAGLMPASGSAAAQGQEDQGPAVLGHEGQALQTAAEAGAGDPDPGLDLAAGTITLSTPDFNLRLVQSSQTVAGLEPRGASAATPQAFDFTPADQLSVREGNGHYHLGDLTMRLRAGGQGEWRDYSTAMDRHPVEALEASGKTLAAADLAPTLPADCPVQVVRRWKLDDGRLGLEFEIRNEGNQPVEIGSLGIPLIFNNMIHNFALGRARTLEDAHAINTFTDPAINMDGGYVQVTRLNGAGPALLVVPDGRTPFEAWNPLNNPPGRGYRHNPMPDRGQIQQTFEGFYEWLIHSKAYAENEWKDADPWNPPTSETLAPGASKTYGVRFLLAPDVRQIEDALVADDRPVAVGIPGYVVPQDVNVELFLKYGERVESMKVEPEGAIEIANGDPTPGGWQSYTLRGKTWGRARLTIDYADHLVQTIHYVVIEPEAQAVADMGHFLFTKAWFTDSSDPFGRAPSVMNYDRANDRIVTQDRRAWVAGLQDEAGSGGWVAASMKQLGQPRKDEVARLERFVDEVVWGGMQYDAEGDPERPMWGVRKSLFYYGAPGYDYDLPYDDDDWMMWVDTPHANGVKRAYSVARAYNYPHVVAAYWTLYRLARYHSDLVSVHDWRWYLDHAYNTIKFLTITGRQPGPDGRPYVEYADTGLMEGDVFLDVLEDLKREGWTDEAAEIEAAMKQRADLWDSRAYPFGSEMAWDSTGQEEVYAWTRYFDLDDKAEVTIDAILGYMPTTPHWGYNGNARRYWDMVYGAAPGGQIERQIHHYGSSLNAIPVLDAYRRDPSDFYLLRVGYAGTMGSLTNIDKEGFPSAAFHAYPARLEWDAYIGDYGANFFGHAHGTAVYVIHHPEFGWQAFGGNVTVDGDTIRTEVLDSFRRRVYLAPLGLWLTLDAGRFDSVEFDAKTHAVRLTLEPSTDVTPRAYLRVSQPARVAGVGIFQPAEKLAEVREAYEIPLESEPTTVELTASAAASR